MIEERKDDPEPVVLDKHEVKRLLASSGVPNEQLDEFDEKYESIADEKASFVASNVASTRNYEIRTPDVIIKVSPKGPAHRNPYDRRNTVYSDRGSR